MQHRALLHLTLVLSLFSCVLSACGDDDSDSNSTPATSAATTGTETTTGTTSTTATTDTSGTSTGTTGSTTDTSGTSTGTTGTLEPLPDQPWDPEERGFYGVGYKAESLTYTPPGSAQERTLRVVFWYPTRDTEGEQARYLGLLGQDGIFDNASVAVTDEEPAPLLVFSHGSTSFAEQSYFMTEFFASHGWVIVAMDHTGNTYQDSGIPPEIFAHRPQDITATLDFALDLPEDHPLHNKIDAEHIALTGHSFGGYTTLAAAGSGFKTEDIEAACDVGGLPDDVCTYFLEEDRIDLFEEGFGDPRIDVAMPQAPFGGAVFGDRVADIDIPVLLFTAALDRTLPPSQDGDPIWDGLDGDDDIRIDLATGGHFTYSNGCEISPQIGEDDGCGEDFIPFERAYYIVNSYALIFAQHHLFGVDTHLDVLSGERILDEDIIFSSK